MTVAASRQPRIRVVLVDDQSLLREGLRTLLELHADIHVVGEAADGVAAEALVERVRPDVALMDLRMPRRGGVDATRTIARHWPETRVLVLTTFDDDELVFDSIDAGASGYLLKDVGSEVLADAVRAAARGESPIQPSVARKLLLRIRERRPATMPPTLAEPLTPRETDILRLLGSGATNRQIADRLALTEGTVKNYVSSILAKTGLHDRTQAALFAVAHGLTQ
jgi:DNA-binding NarL/FixJ family response regulator